jgi:hypothetical protein
LVFKLENFEKLLEQKNVRYGETHLNPKVRLYKKIEKCSLTDDPLISSGSIQTKVSYGGYNDIEINCR